MAAFLENVKCMPSSTTETGRLSHQKNVFREWALI
jgi:hypothetical protein